MLLFCGPKVHLAAIAGSCPTHQSLKNYFSHRRISCMTPLCSIRWEAALISQFMVWFLPRVVDVQGIDLVSWGGCWSVMSGLALCMELPNNLYPGKTRSMPVTVKCWPSAQSLTQHPSRRFKRLALLTVGTWTGSSQRWECFSSDEVGAWVCSDAVKLFSGFWLKRRLRRCPTHPSVWDFPTVIWIPHLSLDIVTQIHCLGAHCLLWDFYVVRLSATNVPEKLGKYFGQFCDSGGLVSKQ